MEDKITEEETKLAETLFDYFTVGTMDIRYEDIARYIITIDRRFRDKQLAEKDAEIARLKACELDVVNVLKNALMIFENIEGINGVGDLERIIEDINKLVP